MLDSSSITRTRATTPSLARPGTDYPTRSALSAARLLRRPERVVEKTRDGGHVGLVAAGDAEREAVDDDPCEANEVAVFEVPPHPATVAPL